MEKEWNSTHDLDHFVAKGVYDMKPWYFDLLYLIADTFEDICSTDFWSNKTGGIT